MPASCRILFLEGVKIVHKKRIGKKLLLIATAVIVVAGIATTALAAGESGVTINGDTLSGGAITFADFAAITLNGQQQTQDATWAIGNIIDPRGTGLGWNLSLSLTPLKEYNTGTSEYVTDGHTIPASSITVKTAPTITEADGTSSPANVLAAVPVSTALDTGTPVKLVIADAGEGMGSYAVTSMTATLAVRADAYAATYKTDATVALVTGP
jgi:hypothetical protein